MDSTTVSRRLIRPAVDGDIEAIAGLFNEYDPDCTSPEIVRGRLGRWQSEDPRLDLVAVNDRDEVIGYTSSLRRASDLPGKFSVNILVAQRAARMGLGRELHSKAEAFAAEHGGTYLSCYIKESIERAVSFAEQDGYKRIQHLFDSELLLSDFDPATGADLIAELEAAGYRFLTLAEVGDNEENRRRVYDLDVTSDIDTPGYENWGMRTYEQYSRDEFQSYGFSPEGVVIVEYEGEWVAMHSCRQSPKPGTMSIDYTGVLREHRGKGLAQAVKLIGIENAKKRGAERVRTSNDERNEPMLAINQKLGFKPEPGFYVYRKDLTATSAG